MISHPGLRASARRPRGGRAFLFAMAVGALAALAPAPAHAIRIATWNLLQYPIIGMPVRQQYFRTVMQALNPDVLVTQETDGNNGAPGRDSMLIDVLGLIQPGQWSAQSIDVGNGEGMAVFWKPAAVTVFNVGALGNGGGPRSKMLFGLRPVGYPAAQFFRVYSMHLKAGDLSTTADSSTRRIECTQLRTDLNALPANTQFILVGDSNFYTANESAYQRLTENQLNNNGRCFDPLGAIMTGNWHVNSSYKAYDTQCPCGTGCIDPAFSGGGMDDRFDLILTSNSMQDGAGFDMVPGSLVAYGNDGLHFDTDINGDGFNNAVGYTVATAIRNSSDHIPVYIDVQVPAKVVATSQLDFGRAILGGAPTQTLFVSDGAPVPGDELNYSLTAPAGFSAPGGGFTVNAGAAANPHSIGMLTASTGAKSGTLTVASNAVDTTSKSVLLSGTVVRHASPSLDSATVVTSSTADFGSHAILHFDDIDVRVHDQGFDALQAQLALNNAVITGGNGRFSIAGGFSPGQIGGTGVTYTLHFDSYGATLDSTYTATLTFSTADEALPGATPLSDLTVSLSAQPISGVDAVVPGHRVLAFEPARPNPLARSTRFAYELPRDQAVSLEIYDLVGRRVASLVSGTQPAGRHEAHWNADDAAGTRVPGGLYFARFTTPGLARVERVVVLP